MCVVCKALTTVILPVLLQYMNSGPGGIAGVFVHEKHANNFDLHRYGSLWHTFRTVTFDQGLIFQDSQFTIFLNTRRDANLYMGGVGVGG